MELVNIGYGSMISAQRLIAVVSPDSAPIKRLIGEARDRSMLIDATFGRKTAAVLIMDSDHVVLSGLPFEKLAPRFGVDPTVLEEEA
ncbi:MAG TPA: DUF370 domain-containing protein [Candidatus Pelethomonas intestinigallinarum]|nr:DUF370 domain-containing protein [Candidatus Pelethomonas intestinigallinarum]